MPPGRATGPRGKEDALVVPPPTSNPGRSTLGRSTSVVVPPLTSNSNLGTPTLGEMATKMPPGRKAPTHPRQALAAPITEYENARAQQIVKNNQMFQRLGIGALTSLLKNACANGKDNGPQKSGSEYNPHDNERLDDDDDEVSVEVSSKGTRGSKRVIPPPLQLEPRVTRQRSVATLSLTASTEDALTTPSSPIQTEDLNRTADEDVLAEVIEQGRRGRSMGKGLDRITRGLSSKICIHISEGKRWPEAPLQAAKLASEGGIVLRQHVPIFPHWKHYKKNKSEIVNYIDKVAGQFTMDTDNKAVTHACVDLLKGGQHQMRYRLKSKYFNRLSEDQVPKTSPVTCMSDEQWLELVAMWSKSEHKDKCLKNKINREKVQFQQRIGSRCYIAQAHVAKQEKFKDSSPTAIDLFKEMHCSKKRGFNEQVKQAIVDMESIIAQFVESGEQEKTFTEAVPQVLPQNNTFLENVGLKISSRKKKTRIGVSSQVQDLQSQLKAKTQESAGLHEQVDALTSKANEQTQEIENLKKSSAETNALLHQLISLSNAWKQSFCSSIGVLLDKIEVVCAAR